MWNRFINTNNWTGAVKYVIYVHYDTILTHTTLGDAKPHPPYDDRIIARRAACFSCTIATKYLAKGHRRDADIVEAIPTLHVREELPGANNWLDCCAAVCKLLKLPAPAERCWYGGIHPPAAHCEPKELATAAGWGQRRTGLRNTMAAFETRCPAATRTAELPLMTLFLWGKELFL